MILPSHFENLIVFYNNYYNLKKNIENFYKLIFTNLAYSFLTKS